MRTSNASRSERGGSSRCWIVATLVLTLLGGCGQRSADGGGDGGPPGGSNPDGMTLPHDDHRVTPSSDRRVNDHDDPGSPWDGGRQPPVTGSCQDPLDTYDPSWGGCIRKGKTCNAITPCPTGYSCSVASPQGPLGEVISACICATTSLCGMVCTTDQQCTPDRICQAGLCREPVSCFSDAGCPTGSVCESRGSVSRCVPRPAPGLKPTGKACASGNECQSLICETGICLQACQKNADCGQGLLCNMVSSWSTGQSHTACTVEIVCSSCTGSDKACIMGECVTPCATAADCSAGDCRFDDMTEGLTCNDLSAKVCQAGEVLHSFSSTSFCLVPTPCWEGVPCASPYTCLTAELGTMGSGICGRRVSPP